MSGFMRCRPLACVWHARTISRAGSDQAGQDRRAQPVHAPHGCAGVLTPAIVSITQAVGKAGRLGNRATRCTVWRLKSVTRVKAADIWS
jgi:hypothetical protein